MIKQLFAKLKEKNQINEKNNKKYPILSLCIGQLSFFGYKINENDKILTLSSCYNDDEKVVLHAKLIKREKKA